MAKPSQAEIREVISQKEHDTAFNSHQLCARAHVLQRGGQDSPKELQQAFALFEQAGKLGNAEGLYNMVCVHSATPAFLVLVLSQAAFVILLCSSQFI
jgi:hypothetical protein